MLESLTLKDLLDLGMQGVLLAGLIVVWRRLNEVTDRILNDRERADAEREVIAALQGMPAHDFHREASYVIERRKRLDAGKPAQLNGQEETD